MRRRGVKLNSLRLSWKAPRLTQGKGDKSRDCSDWKEYNLIWSEVRVHLLASSSSSLSTKELDSSSLLMTEALS